MKITVKSTLYIKVKTDEMIIWCNGDAQVGIYVKLMLIKSNPVVFLLIAKV